MRGRRTLTGALAVVGVLVLVGLVGAPVVEDAERAGLVDFYGRGDLFRAVAELNAKR